MSICIYRMTQPLFEMNAQCEHCEGEIEDLDYSDEHHPGYCSDECEFDALEGI